MVLTCIFELVDLYCTYFSLNKGPVLMPWISLSINMPLNVTTVFCDDFLTFSSRRG